LLFVFWGLVKNNNQKPDPQVIYKYVPRTFVEDQENPPLLNDLYYEMFNAPTPWVGNIDINRIKQNANENAQGFFVHN